MRSDCDVFKHEFTPGQAMTFVLLVTALKSRYPYIYKSNEKCLGDVLRSLERIIHADFYMQHEGVDYMQLAKKAHSWLSGRC